MVRTLVINMEKVIEAIFRMYDETPPNGQYNINVPLGVHKDGATKKYAPEFLQSGSWIPPENNVCEIPVTGLFEDPEEGDYCDSFESLMNFSQARADGRDEAEKQGLLDPESDDLPSDEAQKIIDEYEEQMVSYVKESLGAMLMKAITVDGEKFKIKWS